MIHDPNTFRARSTYKLFLLLLKIQRSIQDWCTCSLLENSTHLRWMFCHGFSNINPI